VLHLIRELKEASRHFDCSPELAGTCRVLIT
jgi:hypothetical protein